MLGTLLAPQMVALEVWGLSALYVHRRGRVRHRLQRQLTDHSTFFAPVNVLMYAASAVPNRPLLDSQDFPDLAPLRLQWRMIRDEAEALLRAGQIAPSEGHRDIAFNTFFRRGWRRFHLKWYGDVLPSAEAACPRTVALLRSIPSVRAALFAFLPAGGTLAEHRDPYAGSLRYHLGLITPNSDDCRIFVDGEPYAWRDGQDIVFDETYVHSAYNRTSQDRLILFCDVERPLHTPVMRALNHFIAGYVLRVTASRNLPTERLGLVNRFSGRIYQLRLLFSRARRANRPLYFAAKYTLIAAVIWLVLLRGLSG